MKRRKILSNSVGTCVLCLLAGCSSPNNGTETSTESPSELYALSGSYTIPAGGFRDLAFDIDDPAVIEYTADVRSGPNIDVLVLSRGEFREYERDNEFELIGNASALDTSYGDVRADLDPKDINLVFDNTGKGTASPPGSDGVAEVDFEITVRRRGDG